MKIFFIFCGLWATAWCFGMRDIENWRNFKGKHQKKYDSEEEENLRFKNFIDNSRKIAEHNQKFEKGLVSYTQEINQFGDLSHEEYVREYASCILNGPTTGHIFVPKNKTFAETVDWRDKGAVTPVKHQGRCASCWAFSSTGAIEGQNFIKRGKLVSLSEQNLVDCTKKYGNNGCHGGFMEPSFKYVKENGGINTEESYPYEGVDGECRFKPNDIGATVTDHKIVKQDDEDNLKQFVAQLGPVAVAIDAGQDSFGFYKDGIYDEPNCSSTQLTHAALAVGYGTENGVDYWLVKNSWGLGWGNNGYIKMSRNKNNQCGIARAGSIPTV